MDIHRWLENTGQETQNPLNYTHAFNRNTSRTQHEHKRKPSSGSIIGPLVSKSVGSNASRPKVKKHHKGKGRVASRSSPSSRALSGWYSSSLPSLSSSSSSASSSVSSLSHHNRSAGRYRKRARHKTNPQKYEPQLEIHEQHTRTDRKAHAKDSRKENKKDKKGKKLEEKDEAKKKKKRRKNERPLGIVQNFRAKNVVKDRLTLDPTNIGLYAQGRASGPTKIQGLPDLVFSEMKFLQKDGSWERHHPPQATTKHENTNAVERKTRKKSTREDQTRHHMKDRKHVEDEEISTYFGINKYHGREQSGNQPTQAYAAHNQSNMIRNTLSEKVGRESANPFAELPEKPFLGFGSSGSRLSSINHRTRSETREQTISSLGLSHRPQRFITIDSLDQLISGQGREESGGGYLKMTRPQSRSGYQTEEQDPPERRTEDIEKGQNRPDGLETANAKTECLGSSGHANMMQKTAEPVEQSRPTNSELDHTAPFPKPGVTASTMENTLNDADKTLQASYVNRDEIIQDVIPEQVQKEQLLLSSPLGKLLRKCSAVISPPLETVHILNQSPADVHQDYAQTTSMGPQKSSAVFSLPVPDIYIHQGTSPNRYEASPEMATEAERALLGIDERLWEREYDRASIGMDEISTLVAFHRNDNVYSLHEELDIEQHDPGMDFGGGYAIEEGEDEDGERYGEDDTANELAGFWRPNRLY